MDNAGLIYTFTESILAGKPVLLANGDLRLEPIGSSLQLLSRSEGMIASGRLKSDPLEILVKETSEHWQTLHTMLLEHNLLPTAAGPVPDFLRYESANIPSGYDIHYTDGLLLLQGWWQRQQQEQVIGPLGTLIWYGRTWHPIRDIQCDRGHLVINTWGSQFTLEPAERIVWLMKIIQTDQPQELIELETANPALTISSSSTPTVVEEISPIAALLENSKKQIGNYLVEAGLLSPAQVAVVLSDQASTGMRFGEIVVSHGWLKEQTVEYLMQNLIQPRQKEAESVAKVLNMPAATSKPSIQRATSARGGSIHDRETLVILNMDGE
jgi:hypothetical protein